MRLQSRLGLCRGQGQAAPRCATSACRLFLAENDQGPADSGRNFDFPSYCLKGFRERTRSRKRAMTIDNHIITSTRHGKKGRT